MSKHKVDQIKNPFTTPSKKLGHCSPLARTMSGICISTKPDFQSPVKQLV